MIFVVVCRVSQPSRKKRKSYVENFVIAQCACFNDEVTLTQHVICLRTFLVFLTRMMIWWVIPVCPFSAVLNEIPKKRPNICSYAILNYQPSSLTASILY